MLVFSQASVGAVLQCLRCTCSVQFAMAQLGYEHTSRKAWHARAHRDYAVRVSFLYTIYLINMIHECLCELN